MNIVPFEPHHYAMLPVRPEQAGELERFGAAPGAMAAHGPAFSAVEQDDKGHVARVLACAGLVEVRSPDHPQGGYAHAWAAFAEGLGPSQWSAITHAIRGVVEGAGYRRIDMLINPEFEAARRYAVALGFTLDQLLFARTAS